MTAEVMAPKVKRIRAYFAPVNRTAKQATIFDPAQIGMFGVDSPPAPWVDLGWISGFERTCSTGFAAIKAGSPAETQVQARVEAEAKLSFQFESWSKLQLALSAGTQQMNLLAVQPGASAAGSGGTAASAVSLQAGSTATSLQLSATDAANFAVNQLVAVDVDYTAGTTGFVGSGVSGAFVKTPLTDVDYVRRVTLNVARIQSISNGLLTLEGPLLAGIPTSAMKVSGVVGFCDREGSTFFQEWSGLFVAEGQQGERVVWHYPRLQTSSAIAEGQSASAGEYRTLRLKAGFAALPVIDPVDGESVLCFRSFLNT